MNLRGMLLGFVLVSAVLALLVAPLPLVGDVILSANRRASARRWVSISTFPSL